VRLLQQAVTVGVPFGSIGVQHTVAVPVAVVLAGVGEGGRNPRVQLGRGLGFSVLAGLLLLLLLILPPSALDPGAREQCCELLEAPRVLLPAGIVKVHLVLQALLQELHLLICQHLNPVNQLV